MISTCCIDSKCSANSNKDNRKWAVEKSGKDASWWQKKTDRTCMYNSHNNWGTFSKAGQLPGPYFECESNHWCADAAAAEAKVKALAFSLATCFKNSQDQADTGLQAPNAAAEA